MSPVNAHYSRSILNTQCRSWILNIYAEYSISILNIQYLSWKLNVYIEYSRSILNTQCLLKIDIEYSTSILNTQYRSWTLNIYIEYSTSILNTQYQSWILNIYPDYSLLNIEPEYCVCMHSWVIHVRARTKTHRGHSCFTALIHSSTSASPTCTLLISLSRTLTGTNTCLRSVHARVSRDTASLTGLVVELGAIVTMQDAWRAKLREDLD